MATASGFDVMMIAFRFLILTLLLVITPASAQKPDEPAIQTVISSQLEALNKGDQNAAFAFASPMIQGMFQDAANFMAMVERGYPQVYRSRAHRFLDLKNADGRLIQRVLIESDAGTVVGNYEMVLINGGWRINGVSFDPAGDA